MQSEFRDERQFKDRYELQRRAAQRDRDRVLHSAAFRRLANVTQVVDPSEGHVFHNRLTHTLKVAQVARRLAEKLLEDYRGEGLSFADVDPEVVETAALIHDMGHPPFGHIAEETLDDLLVQQGVLDGYEGNAQSFRIITRLAVRHDAHEGLNLTRATLNAVLKYPWLRDTANPNTKRNRKWGVYNSEQGIFAWVRKYGPEDGLQSLEASIMDWADDIAFAVHDVEDFYRAGLIPLHQLAKWENTKPRNENTTPGEIPEENEPTAQNENTERTRFYRSVYERWQRSGQDNQLDFEDHQRAFEDSISTFPVEEPFEGARHQVWQLNLLITEWIMRYVSATKLQWNAERECWELSIKEGTRREMWMLKQLTWHYVIDSPTVTAQQYGKHRVIQRLFGDFMDIVNDKAARWLNVLPLRMREYLGEQGAGQEEQPKARLVADLISGLTDHEALALHKRLTGINPGTLFDLSGR